MKRTINLILLSVLVFGCQEKLPPELEQERAYLNESMDRTLNKEENSEKYRNSTRILVDFENLKRSNLSYKKLLEEQGYGDQFNDEVITFLDEKISKYANNGFASSDESIKHTCNICGKRFVGNGYEETSTGLWVLTKDPYQSFICSRECGAIHTERQVKNYGF